jgi:hypothetical protein
MKPEYVGAIFFFEDSPVGHFEGEEIPSNAGTYRYMPYRGPVHYRLIGALKSLGPQRCHYVIAGRRHYFTVQAWVSYGLLESTGFDSVDSTTS